MYEVQLSASASKDPMSPSPRDSAMLRVRVVEPFNPRRQLLRLQVDIDIWIENQLKKYTFTIT